jgi:hypothetical protein
MRKELYEALTKALDGIGFEHFDLWNRQVEFLDEDAPFPTPALFIEFGDITWKELSGGTSFSGEGTVILHIVDRFDGSAVPGGVNRDAVLSQLDWSAKIQRALLHLRGENFNGLRLTTTMTNHDHEDVIESIEVYSFKTMRELR